MTTTKLRTFILFFLLFSSNLCNALTSQLPPINPWQQWTFTGSVFDEKGKTYYYYFVFQQHEGSRMVDVLVFSNQFKEIIRYHKVSAKESKRSQKPNIWKVGRSFFRFNPITKSWVFGLKAKDDKGFNFKADIRTNDGDMGERQSISEGLHVEMYQFQQLNGHLFFSEDKTERFVSAKRGWLRYIEGTQPPNKLIALLCNLEEGGGLYSLQYESAQAKKASIVGWRNGNGDREMVSQFITIKSHSDNRWKITIPSPKTKWSMDYITNFLNEPFDTFVLAMPKEKQSVICFYQAKNIATIYNVHQKAIVDAS